MPMKGGIPIAQSSVSELFEEKAEPGSAQNMGFTLKQPHPGQSCHACSELKAVFVLSYPDVYPCDSGTKPILDTSC